MSLKTKLMTIGGTLIVIAVIVLVLVFSNGQFDKKGSKNSKDMKDSVKELYLQYMSDYEVLNETDQGIQLSVTCPNFEEIAKQMAQEDMEITAKNLNKMLKNNSDLEKEYVFFVTELTKENINKAFLEKVAYDMMVSAIQEVEYQESWEIEE